MKEIFEFTQEHRLLLQGMYVRWEDCEYGAPAIDCKRPYGNSDVHRDIEDICDLILSPEKAYELHKETLTALELVLQEGRYPVGTIYGRENSWTRWEPIPQ